MFLMVSDNRDIQSLTAEQLKYILKVVLLREFRNCIDQLWDRLSEHIRADLEIQYRRCLKHYNLSCQTHIDGPAPLIKNCSECQACCVINALPFELHIPGYQFCGPRTHLEKRLAKGDRGINPLDATCREHDIAYSRSNDLAERHVADNILATKARKFLSREIQLSERELLQQPFGL